MRRLFCLLAATTLLSACAAGPGPQPHFLLLGEVHDNVQVHDKRAAYLGELLRDGRPTVVVFEQMFRDRDAAIAAAPRESEAIADAGQLDRKNWRWPMHKPIIDAALAGGAQLVGGNLERDTARALVRQGESVWPADLAALRAASGWGDAQQREMAADIEQSHCGAMPSSMMPGMVLAQRGRDAAMAEAMLQARRAGAERVVLIAGNGHVRRDLAVPLYLLGAGVPAADIESVGYLEEGSGQSEKVYDRVIYSPPARREDPCKVLRG